MFTLHMNTSLFSCCLAYTCLSSLNYSLALQTRTWTQPPHGIPSLTKPQPGSSEPLLYRASTSACRHMSGTQTWLRTGSRLHPSNCLPEKPPGCPKNGLSSGVHLPMSVGRQQNNFHVCRLADPMGFTCTNALQPLGFCFAIFPFRVSTQPLLALAPTSSFSL